MKDQNSQERNKKHKQGGYMRSLHKVEQKLYSPELKLSGANAFKVLLYIRHNTIRWDKQQNQLSYGDISKETGIDKRQVRKIIAELVDKKLIIKISSSINNVDNKNLIALNSDYFGELIEETGRPNFSVIEGGASEKLSTIGFHSTPQGLSHSTPGGGAMRPSKHGQEPLSEPQPSLLKNPLKEQYKKLLSKIPESFTLSGRSDREVEEENREKLRLQREELEARGWK